MAITKVLVTHTYNLSGQLNQPLAYRPYFQLSASISDGAGTNVTALNTRCYIDSQGRLCGSSDSVGPNGYGVYLYANDDSTTTPTGTYYTVTGEPEQASAYTMVVPHTDAPTVDLANITHVYAASITPNTVTYPEGSKLTSGQITQAGGLLVGAAAGSVAQLAPAVGYLEWTGTSFTYGTGGGGGGGGGGSVYSAGTGLTLSGSVFSVTASTYDPYGAAASVQTVLVGSVSSNSASIATLSGSVTTLSASVTTLSGSVATNNTNLSASVTNINAELSTYLNGGTLATSTPTYTWGAGAGTSPTGGTVTGSGFRGTFTGTTGTSCSTATFVTINYGVTLSAAPTCVLVSGLANSPATLKFYVSQITTTGFSVTTTSAPASSTNNSICWLVVP